MKMRERQYKLAVSIVIAVALPFAACTNKGSETSNTGTTPRPANVAPTPSPTPPSPENVSKSIEQITAIINNAKQWRTQGHSYGQLNLEKAISDGIIPKDMIKSDGRVLNPWLGAVSIQPHPEIADSFTIIFSAVPNADCVQLALQGRNSFDVRAGNWGGTATSEDQAKAVCVSGNMWFIPK